MGFLKLFAFIVVILKGSVKNAYALHDYAFFMAWIFRTLVCNVVCVCVAYFNVFVIVRDHIVLVLCDLRLYLEIKVGTFITVVLILL